MLFQDPQGLPPWRSNTHRIQLLSNISLVSVQPYRYPQFQKNEISMILQEMLQTSIISPSTNAFSLEDLLEKKKDGI